MEDLVEKNKQKNKQKMFSSLSESLYAIHNHGFERSMEDKKKDGFEQKYGRFGWNKKKKKKKIFFSSKNFMNLYWKTFYILNFQKKKNSW